MIRDFRDYDAQGIVDCDLCIAGAGAAGITIARKLAGGAARIILLESGGYDYEEDTQALYKGANVGRSYFDLDTPRLRFLGGTTNHWAGECSVLDEIDFEPRPWVEASGWPIDRADLDPFYPEAHQIVGIGAFDYDTKRLVPSGQRYLDFAPDRLVHKIWRFSRPPTRFGEAFREDLDQAPSLEVWLHANLTEIETDEGGRHIKAFHVASLEGKRTTVVARCYVLAMGGLENPRMLLNARRHNPAGVGNGRDLVGRYFMDHLNAIAGQVTVLENEWQNAYGWFDVDGVVARTNLRPSPVAQAERTILNSAVHLGPKPSARARSRGFKALRRIKAALLQTVLPSDIIDAFVDIVTDLDGIYAGLAEYYLDKNVYVEIEGEQAPNRDSRVLLADTRDELGLQQIKLDWRLSEIDKRSIRGLCQLIGEEVGRLGVGRVAMEDWLLKDDDDWGEDFVGGNHHIGTTRMAETAERGVVDANCRVHGVDNLYVAGSSVFPTSGCANPTLTITALSLRLAEHLRPLVQGRGITHIGAQKQG